MLGLVRGSGHGAPVFTGGLLAHASAAANHAGPLRHVAGFPGLGLLRVLRPTPAASADDGPSRPPRLAAGRGGDHRDGSHVHSEPFDGIGAQLCPCSLATATPQTFTVASRPATSPGQGVPRRRPVGSRRVRAATQPRSARFELVGLLRSVQPLVPHVRLSVLLAGPGPSGSAGPSRRCQGCFHPHPRPGDQAALSFNPLLRQRERGVFHLRSVKQRLVAHEVGYPQPVWRWRMKWRSTRSG